MKKKIVILGISLVVILALAFVYINKLESKIEDSIRDQIAQSSATVESVQYCLLLNTLYLDKLRYEVKDSASIGTLNIENVVVKNFNSEFSDSEMDVPSIFDKLSVEGLTFVLKDTNATEMNLEINTIDIFSYAHNLTKLFEEYKKDVASEAFFKALLNYKHGGIYIEGCTLTGEFEEAKMDSFLEIRKVEIEAVDNPQITSFHYKNIHIESDGASFESEQLHARGLQIPDAKKISAVTKTILNALVNSNSSNRIGSQQFYDKLVESMYSDSDQQGKAPFCFISLEKVQIIPPYNLCTNIEKVKREAITFDTWSVGVDTGDTNTVRHTLENLAISSEYLAVFDEELYKTGKAFLPEEFLINSSSVGHVNPETGIARSETSLSLRDLFHVSMNGTFHYTDEDWLTLFLYTSGEGAANFAYKELKATYIDEGFLPLVAYMASSLTGLPVDSFVPLAKQQLESITTKTKTNDPGRTQIADDILSAMVAMLEKPGSITAKIIFDEPLTVHEIESIGPSDPLLLKFSIETEQGDKSLSELIAETLKSEK